jgi:hypothetical protein
VAHTGGGVRALGATGRALAQDLPRHEAEFPSLAGVPAPPFGEALALVFQARALRILAREPAGKARDLAALDGFWRAYAGAGAAMVETAAWHWLYDHPGAAAAELEAAIAASARAVWNRYYAPVFGRKDCLVLAGGLPTQGGLQRSGCPIGMLIAFQLQREIDRSGKPGATLERCARLGRLTPDLWLLRATGTPLGPGALLEATATALRDLGN